MNTLRDLKLEILKINALGKYRQSNSGNILSQNAQEIISEIQIMAGGKGFTHLRDSSVIKTVPNDFIASIADSVMKFGNCSEKQAYCLAKYAFDNGIKISERVK